MKRALHVVGALLCVAAIVFFANGIRNAGIALPPGGIKAVAAPLLAASAAYGLAVLLLSVLWSILLLGRTDRHVVASYLVAQFGKYIPGNVFQFVGRHVLGRELGIGHGVLARAAVYEIGFLVATAGLVAGLLVVRTPEGLEWLRPVAAVGGVAVLAAILFAWRLGIRHPMVLELSFRHWSVLSLGYLAFFVGFGALYWACLRIFGLDPALGEPIGSASLGWILGFVVPGAPAGAGLREATMSLVSVGEDAHAAAAFGAIVAFRVVTMCGDLFAFLLGLWMRHRHRASRRAASPEKQPSGQSHLQRQHVLADPP